MASVTFSKATRLYPGGTRPAVNAIDLLVKDGEFLVLVGPSGCGKTTTLRLIAGFELQFGLVAVCPELWLVQFKPEPALALQH